MKLLEQNGVIQTFKDGALLNYIASGKQNGSLSGCTIYQDDAVIIAITKGTLVVQGYRVSFEDEVIYNPTVLPATEEYRYIKLRITVSEAGAVASIHIDTNRPIHFGAIESEDGIYEYLMATIKIGALGITEFIPGISPLAITPPGESSATGWIELASAPVVAGPDGEIYLNVANDYAFIIIAGVNGDGHILSQNYVMYPIEKSPYGNMDIYGVVPGIANSSCRVLVSEASIYVELMWLVYSGDSMAGGYAKIYGMRR